MGAYAAWLDDQPAPRRSWTAALLAACFSLWHHLAKRFIPSRRVFLVTDFEPSREQLHERLGGLPGWMALPVPPATLLPQVRTTVIATGTNPIDFGSSLGEARSHGIDVVAFWLPWSEIRGKTLLHLWKSGFRWGWLLRGTHRLAAPLVLLLLWRGMLSWWQKRRGTATDLEVTPNQEQRFRAAAPVPCSQQGPLRIGHFIRTWMFGGVERQLGLLAQMQYEAGHRLRVFLQTAPQRQADGSLRWLPKAIPAETIATRLELLPTDMDQSFLASLPEDLRGMVIDLAGELRRHPVDVLHCWIDEANVVGLLAARLAGIPAVALSVLGVSPHHWPLGHKPWMRAWYRVGLQTRNVSLIGISEAGLQDYAQWLDLPAPRLSLVRIAFPPPPLPTPEAVQRVRNELGLHLERPVVIGVFRLDPEKRPLFFLKVIQRLRELVPDVQVLHAGGGSLRDAFQAEIDRLGLHQTVRLLGQPVDVLTPMAASDVFLMVSEAEGTPNVSLEAQYLGCVPVLTDVGGCRETMIPHHTGLVLPKDDLEGIAQGVAGLLRDASRRRQLVQAGRGFVREQYAPEKMLQGTLELYQRLLFHEDHPVRRSA